MLLSTAAQMRELDRKAIEERGIPSLELMERAATGIASAALSILPTRAGKGRAAIFCGTGNNGGDGLAAARLLASEGLRVRTYLVGDREKLTPDAQEELRRLSERVQEPYLTIVNFDPRDAEQASWTKNAHIVIDALFGVGLSREIQSDSPWAAAISLINRARGAVIAADIASGIDADSGRVMGCAVRADRTITFTAPKIGHAVGDGFLYSGAVSVHDIGIPSDLLRTLDKSAQTIGKSFVRWALPPRKPDGHKGDFGTVFLIGGSGAYRGAPYLMTSAALRSGCGMVFLGTPGRWSLDSEERVCAIPVVLDAEPDSGGLAWTAAAQILQRVDSCDVLALGPGLGRADETADAVREVLRETRKAVVLDADGINALAGHIDILDERRGRVTILTPHDGEFARLLGDGVTPRDIARGNRVKLAREFAVKHDCVLVLKGHRTISATPSGTVLVNTTGNSGLAKGGSGDVLTGLIASLLAQGATPIQAAAGGVWIHGRAADFAADALTPYAMTPVDVIAAFPSAFAELLDAV